MKILSHRGYWKAEAEKNTEMAFNNSFSLSFGTETDVRDFNGRLVISHDIATGTEIGFEKFMGLANLHTHSEPLTLALNVKADGLASLIGRAIKDYKNLDCFVFDMSVPDMRDYLNKGIPAFTRMSEVEQQPAWLDRCEGVWLDGFESEWFANSLIHDLLSIQKRVCIVSPELHRRDHLAFWKRIKPLADEPLLMLCTDFPEQALKFFQND
jgi:glycerophosphoryl diester phosphodiesterase